LTTAEAYKSIWHGLDAINKAIPVNYPILESEKQQVISREFWGRSREISAWISEQSDRDDGDEAQGHHECDPQLVSAMSTIYKKFRTKNGMNQGR
jgi:hypothetical protein